MSKRPCLIGSLISYHAAEKDMESHIASSFVSWHETKFCAKVDYMRECYEAGESEDDAKKAGSDDSTCAEDSDEEEAAKLPLLYSDYVVPADCAFESDFQLPKGDLGINYVDKLPKRLQFIENKIIEMTKKDFVFHVDDDITIAKANMDSASDKLIKAEAALRFVNDRHKWQVEDRLMRTHSTSDEEELWHGLLYDMTRVFYKRRNMYWAAAENYYKAKSDKWKASQHETVPKQLRLGFPQMM